MIRVEGISKVFRGKGREIRALDGVDLSVAAGEFVAIRGPSGSGKTTLLLAVGGMLRPTSGRVLVGGRDAYALGEGDRARMRAETIGFVFQMFHLVPYLTLLENVLLAARRTDARLRAEALIERLGLLARRGHKPSELSAGERQRTAIARALLNEPKIILADEPTGNLDEENAAGVLEALSAFHRSGGTVLLVTHGSDASRHSSRVVTLRAGRVDGDGRDGRGA
jgi:putative ABC transport system ATP-binding protein